MGTIVDGNRRLSDERPKHGPMTPPRIEEMKETLMALLGRKIEYAGPSLSARELFAYAQTLVAGLVHFGLYASNPVSLGYEALPVRLIEMALQRNEYPLNGDRKEHVVLVATRNKGSPLKALFMQSASPILTIWIFRTRPLRPHRRLDTMGRLDRAIAAALRGEYENAKQLQELFGGQIDVNSLLAEVLEGMAALLDEKERRGELG